MVIRMKIGVEIMKKFNKLIDNGIGRIITISISNTRNKTARIKKRSENGIRALFLGSKPHS